MAYFAPYIDETGIHMPTYEDRLSDLCDKYRAIFGQEAALDPAVPDYQLLSVFAKALDDDTSAYVLSAYNSRNPAYATGQALDLLLPLYGISREAGESDASVRNRMNAAIASRGIFTFDALAAALREIAGGVPFPDPGERRGFGRGRDSGAYAGRAGAGRERQPDCGGDLEQKAAGNRNRRIAEPGCDGREGAGAHGEVLTAGDADGSLQYHDQDL